MAERHPHARHEEDFRRLGQLLASRARAKGLTGKRFEKLWVQIKGFASYGFCHGHALAFADHCQGSAWLLRHYPAPYLAGVLSAEPCGCWPVATIVAEAQRRGVPVLPPCINRSAALRWTVERTDDGRQAIRCALDYVSELGAVAAAVQGERERRGPFESLVDFSRRCALSREQWEWLVLSGAFDALSPHRRQTLWGLPSLLAPRRPRAARGVATGQTAMEMEIPFSLPVGLPDFDARERFTRQWAALGFSPEGNPMQFFRAALQERKILPCAALQQARPGSQVTLAGLVVRPHRPPDALGTDMGLFLSRR